MKQILHSILIAAAVAAVLEALVFGTYACVGGIGPDGPNAVGFITIFILHWPGVVLADVVRLGGTADTAFIAFTGFLQYFLITLVVLVIRNRRRTAIANQQMHSTACRRP